jgi:ribosomal-protein-alanine acetyltransferase
MQIRLANVSDLPQLGAISLADAFAAHWTQQQWLDIFHSQTPPRFAWIAEDIDAPDQPRAIGFLVAQCGPEWELENIVVSPASRRQGVGRALLSALLNEARAHCAERILLEVRASNHAAIRLYLRNGFQQLSRRRDYYLNPTEDALILVHALD